MVQLLWGSEVNRVNCDHAWNWTQVLQKVWTETFKKLEVSNSVVRNSDDKRSNSFYGWLLMVTGCCHRVEIGCQPLNWSNWAHSAGLSPIHCCRSTYFPIPYKVVSRIPGETHELWSYEVMVPFASTKSLSSAANWSACIQHFVFATLAGVESFEINGARPAKTGSHAISYVHITYIHKGHCQFHIMAFVDIWGWYF